MLLIYLTLSFGLLSILPVFERGGISLYIVADEIPQAKRSRGGGRGATQKQAPAAEQSGGIEDPPLPPPSQSQRPTTTTRTDTREEKADTGQDKAGLSGCPPCLWNKVNSTPESKSFIRAAIESYWLEDFSRAYSCACNQLKTKEDDVS